jgi:hypothetical protein
MNNHSNEPNLDEIRDTELTRLDRLLEQYFISSCAGDYKASELYLQTSKRKAELLGLDAPTESRLEVDTYDQAELSRQYEFFKNRTTNQRPRHLDDGTVTP